jgi:hypothetical protein
MIIGEQRLIMNVMIVTYPSGGDILTVEKWRERIAVYRTRNQLGHFSSVA